MTGSPTGEPSTPDRWIDRLEMAGDAPVQPRRPLLHWLSLGWSATSVPVAPLLLLGIALGPWGIGLLSPAVLSSIDPAMPVALAVLGVLVGLGTGAGRSGERRMMAAAFTESAVTAVIVAAGIGTAAGFVGDLVPVPGRLFAVVVGICAASSLVLPSANPAASFSRASRVMDLDVLLPIAAGGVALAYFREGSAAAAWWLAVQACLVVLLLAVVGWLLLAKTTVETERRVFATATLLLVGGAADYLSYSALLGGLVAGAFWRRVGGPAREGLHRDALYVQHPLVVLVLLGAGARAEFSPVSLGLAAAYVCLRTIGKLAGGAAARRTGATPLPRELGMRLLPPGVFGVAFAMNALRSAGPDLGVAVTVVVVGTIGAEVVAMLAKPREGAA